MVFPVPLDIDELTFLSVSSVGCLKQAAPSIVILVIYPPDDR